MKCCHFFSFRLLRVFLYFAFLPFSVGAQSIQSDTLTIYFPFNRYTINNNESARLNSFLNKHAFTDVDGIVITVTGYTDTAGTEKYNAALSMRRCQSVNNAILQKVTANKGFRFQIMPMGEKNAVGQTDSINRRATIVIYSRNSQPAAEQPGSAAIIEKEKPVKNADRAKDKVIDTVIVLDNIYFEPDLPILTPGSINALPYYVGILKKYKNNDMEVGGHVNHTDSKLQETDPLFKLSEKRAKEVYEYLIDYGFYRAKLTHKGYGNARLLFPLPANIEEKRKNMRVEITVFKMP
jgi:outer membrane protein OmpA-like peptidoglycan-associated protein